LKTYPIQLALMLNIAEFKPSKVTEND